MSITTQRYADAHNLVCPGCQETVSCQPPNLSHDESEFSHRDGSALCGGEPEPIERTATR